MSYILARSFSFQSVAAHVTALIQSKCGTDKLPAAGWVPFSLTLDVKQVNAFSIFDVTKGEYAKVQFSLGSGMQYSIPLSKQQGEAFQLIAADTHVKQPFVLMEWFS